LSKNPFVDRIRTERAVLNLVCVAVEWLVGLQFVCSHWRTIRCWTIPNRRS